MIEEIDGEQSVRDVSGGDDSPDEEFE